MTTRFLLNGEPQTIQAAPTRTLLDWLREDAHLCGTKEGCNEGDCGACTVMVTDPDGTARALNACILFLPQLDGRAVRTVEGISAPDGTLHPVQAEMITHHGSQCGFCTLGFITTMATAHLNGATDHEDQIAGNLCRCTGYAPILRAAHAAATAPVPPHMQTDAKTLSSSNFLVPKISQGESAGRGTASPLLQMRTVIPSSRPPPMRLPRGTPPTPMRPLSPGQRMSGFGSQSTTRIWVRSPS